MPSEAWASRISCSVENGTSPPARAQRGREVGHLLVAVRAVAAQRQTCRRGTRARRVASVWSRSSRSTTSYGGSRMRLAKYLAHAGVASRRASETIIANGRVTVDGAVDHRSGARRRRLAARSRSTAGASSREPEAVVYLLHKPRHVVSTARTRSADDHRLARAPDGERLYPVGRLDYDTTGLILITNDGDLAHRLTHPKFEVPRTYRARVANPPVHEPALRALREGVELEDGVTAPAKVRRLASGYIELTIHEGKKRQVKRMLEAVGHPVCTLERVAFGPLRLGVAGARRLPRADPGGDRAAALAWLNSALVMRLVALRGANTVTENTAEAILAATDTLMREILARNKLRRRRSRELHLHAHAGPRRHLPGRRRARDGPVPRPAAVRPRDPRPGRAAEGHPRADPRLQARRQRRPSTSISARR